MRRAVGFAAASALALGCGAPAGPAAVPTAQVGPPARGGTVAAQAAGVLPNVAYQFLGPQVWVFRFDVPAEKVRSLVDPRLSPEVRNGRSPVFAILAEFHAAAVLGLPATGVKARQISYAVLCDKTGASGGDKGFATFALVEDTHLFTLLMKDVGYPAARAPLRWARAGNGAESTGEATFALTRRTDPISRVERTASLTRLLVGKHDHVPRDGTVTEIPYHYPVPVLEGYAVDVAHARFGTLVARGLVTPEQRPSDAWWWEGGNFIVGKRRHYSLPN
ncbi:MAG: hypothetical protein FJZ01_09740 [Candidatus Sericytochromatia bacterium]|nr:hypothetical protein [Candidatus Tanganyikabacteria bacterium]